MSFRIFNVSIKISYLLIVMLTLFSFYDKTGIAVCAFFAALLHELGHIVAAVALGCNVREIAFMPFGIRMKLLRTAPLSVSGKKIILLAAGCYVNVLCFTVFFVASGRLTAAALAHLAAAVFNILPVGTLDGGRILSEILALKMRTEKAQKICDFVSLFLATIMFLTGTAVLIKTRCNASLAITSAYLAFLVIVRQKS